MANFSLPLAVGWCTPTDLDECKAKEAVCVHPALCANTYGGYRCVCNGTTDVDETQSCILGEDLSVLYYRPANRNGSGAD